MEEQMLKDSETAEETDELTGKITETIMAGGDAGGPAGEEAAAAEKRGTAKPVLLALVVLGAVYFALMTVSMVMSVQAGGYTLAAGEAVMYFYQYNGLIILALLLFGIFALAGGRFKAVLVKTFAWGAVLTSLIMAAPVFSQLYMLPQVDALTGFNFLVMYIPMLCVTVSFVGLLSQWHSENRKPAVRVSFVAAAVSAVITVYYGVNVIDPAAQYETFQYLQLVGILCADALMVLSCAAAGYLGVKQEAFRAAAGIGLPVEEAAEDFAAEETAEGEPEEMEMEAEEKNDEEAAAEER